MVSEDDGKASWLMTCDFFLAPFTSLSPLRRNCLIAAFISAVLSLVWLVTFAESHPALFRSIPILTGQYFAMFTSVLAIAYAALRAVASKVPSWRSTEQDGGPLEGWLVASAELGAYLLLFFACDRTTITATGVKYESRDAFWYTCFTVFGISLFTLKKYVAPLREPTTPSPALPTTAAEACAREEGGGASNTPSEPLVEPHVKPLQRDQTEEWKGWMQLMFLWYHYFHEVEIYNAIRLYIAAYVWMTGFGNFSYYYVRRDFSVTRFCTMQWRLNFLVVWVCLILGNEYMLYYICMLHTTFTVMIYAGLGVVPWMNQTTKGIATKFAVLTLLSVLIWDVPGVFDWVWAPLTWVVRYHDPYSPQRPPMAEWHFRSGLDHLLWIVGMACAYGHPLFDSWLIRIDAMPRVRQYAVKTAVTVATMVVLAFYATHIFSLPKRRYNAWHPYTSWIPILGFIVLRNLFATVRRYHIGMLAFFGKVTLETYVAQFHIWMLTTGRNGSPKFVWRVLPSDYPMMNFAIVSVFFLFVSYRLFAVTNGVRPLILPSGAAPSVIARNVILAALCGLSLFSGVALLVRSIVGTGAV